MVRYGHRLLRSIVSKLKQSGTVLHSLNVTVVKLVYSRQSRDGIHFSGKRHFLKPVLIQFGAFKLPKVTHLMIWTPGGVLIMIFLINKKLIKIIINKIIICNTKKKILKIIQNKLIIIINVTCYLQRCRGSAWTSVAPSRS